MLQSNPIVGYWKLLGIFFSTSDAVQRTSIIIVIILNFLLFFFFRIKRFQNVFLARDCLVGVYKKWANICLINSYIFFCVISLRFICDFASSSDDSNYELFTPAIKLNGELFRENVFMNVHTQTHQIDDHSINSFIECIPVKI